ncbi:hypothetical protein RO3G_11954 [Rhizopus delemar RA 99-880]|uniref:Uncharacterized protein n=1 Tax=Rhizopus delemar (strain RA 99-880 / ATCC MYA-4621 / FGSC 9543 / NRRL 43880) TaxID=246409 RepID=I1CFL3_RHIO9|nr:hypothetical protein RO3G_11954 [Rhizopus delemar RA 99-880]|eukprot:EIE87243.1 hypothetical protein RO3G_11954 [Rhizopus delemar RA 99-880]
MLSTRNTRGSKILNAAAGPSSPDLEVTVQNLSHALEAVTTRLSALEQLKLELETLRGENARLAETNQAQANEIASLRAELAARSAGVPTSTPNSNAAVSSYAAPNGAKATAPSPSLGTAASTWATVASRSAKNKLRRRAAAARGFQPVSGEQGFEYVYIPRSRRMTYTEARRRLSRLGVDSWRVLDVCFPAHSVAGLLVHLQYKPVLLSLFEKAKIPVLDTFDPLDPKNLADPKYDSVSEEERNYAISCLNDDRSRKTLERLRYPVALSVSRYLLAQALVSDETVSEILSGKEDRPKLARHLDDMAEDMALDDYEHHRPASRSSFGSL